MAGFSSSQVSDMISRRRYEIRRGDTLSELAESFMKAFPTLKRFSRSQIEDMIFNENKHTFGQNNKNLLLDNKSLELKWILEARRREFRFDHSAKEYVFTDEDRVAYALKDRDFWDHFCRCDRDCGEYLRESFKEQSLSSLPKAMSLNHKISGSCCHKDLMENVKRDIGSFKKAVKLDLISEKILKIIGYSNPSSSQIGDLSKKLTEENRLNTCRDEKCTCVSINQIEKLSTKCVEELYKKAPLNSSQKDSLKKSEYVVTKADEKILGDEKKFWESLEKGIGSSLDYAKEVYRNLGLSLKPKENEKIFISPKNIDDIKGKWSSEWTAVEKFWDAHKPNNGNGKETFKKYWLWSHEFVKFEEIFISEKKTEICDIKYVMHYMGQGAYNKEYAIKIVEMTKAIMKGKDYLLCEKDDSMKELIEPSTLYLFKSINSSAQKKFIELMLEVKEELGSSFQKFYITSGQRGGVEHAYTVIHAKLRNGTLKNYYTLEPTRRYCNAIADIYNGNIPDWTLIDEKARNRMQTIQKGDLGQATDIAAELINAGYFLGTDHKNKDALDFRSNNTSYKLELVAISKDHFTYSDKTTPKKKMEPHVHITIK